MQEDLAAFHQSHFKKPINREKLNTAFNSAQLGTGVDYASHENLEQDLGYYEDGTKRTLTDDQIAMFRHSEIQRLLLERRLRSERQHSNDADNSLDGDSNALASGEDHSNERTTSLTPIHGNTDAIEETSGSLTKFIQPNERMTTNIQANSKKEVSENKELGFDVQGRAAAATSVRSDESERHLLVYDDM